MSEQAAESSRRHALQHVVPECRQMSKHAHMDAGGYLAQHKLLQSCTTGHVGRSGEACLGGSSEAAEPLVCRAQRLPRARIRTISPDAGLHAHATMWWHVVGQTH